jgi:high-affinity nickel-transport protein
MLSLLAVTVVASFLLGMRHATDPDHVVAVTTIVSRERSAWRAAGIGALWGLGHTVTIVAVGGAIILFKVEISPRVGLSMEFAVALMLVALGVFNMVGGFRATPDGEETARPTSLPPLLVGTVHGLAGSGAATLLVMSLIPDPRWAAAALLVFSLGTILGLALVTTAIAVPSAYAGARVVRLQRGLRVASGIASACFGLYLAHRIGFVDGLFTATPHWTPQ